MYGRMNALILLQTLQVGSIQNVDATYLPNVQFRTTERIDYRKIYLISHLAYIVVVLSVAVVVLLSLFLLRYRLLHFFVFAHNFLHDFQ